MKILQLIQRPQLRGAEIFACQLAEQLTFLGHEVDVMILFGENTMRLPFSLPFFYLHANEEKRWWDIASYKQLNRFINARGYDIVQANAGDTLKYASLSKMLYKWKAKLVFRNANKISDFLQPFLKLRVNKLLMKQVDFVASVSEECRSDFERTFAFGKQQLATLPIGVSSSNHAWKNPLASLNIDVSAPVLLSVAGFVKEKNHAGLLRIFLIVLQQEPSAQLLLVGEGKLKAAIQEQVNTLGIRHAVRFLGHRQDVPAIMQHCTILVMPSLIEGLPGVILESFANKLPVIAYGVGGIPEVLQHRTTGFLIKKNDEQDFASQVIAALGLPPGELDIIKNNAFDLATEQYDNKIIARRFESAYLQLLNVEPASKKIANAG